MLYPELQHGKAVSFWEDELRMDLEQERHLARLEGKPGRVREYAARESTWRNMTVPYEA